ncbi:MAG TPA: ATP-binding protein [Candidatus Saccharimonadales bacterium]|nr:ATP-binding protein [Candidatus Saccharimonadales bacterium]
MNAIDAYDDNILLAAKVVRVEIICQQKDLVIQVSDWGKGITKEQRSHIFEPFYTTKGPAGLGIGLAVIKDFVETDFEGHISFTSSSWRGTRFTVRLPFRDLSSH